MNDSGEAQSEANKGSSETELSGSHSDGEYVLNELLCFVQFHIHRSTRNNIAEVVLRHFSEPEITVAKEILVYKYDELISHKIKKRRNVPGKTKSESTVDDILTVMMELDGKEVSTSFVAKDLNRLPKCDPKDIDPYANHQLIMALQERVHRLEDNMSEAKAEIICNQDAVRRIKNTQEEMETVVTNLVAEPPSYAGVTSGNSLPRGCSRNNLSQRDLCRRHYTQSETEDEPSGRDDEAVSQLQEASVGLNNGMPDGDAATANGDAEPRVSGVDDGGDRDSDTSRVVTGGRGDDEVGSEQHGVDATRGGDGGGLGSSSGNGSVSRDGALPLRGTGAPRTVGAHRNGNPWITVGPNGKPVKSNPPRQPGGGFLPRHVGENPRQGGRRRVQGSATSNMFKGAPPPRRDFFLSRVVSTTDDQVIKDYIRDKGINDFELQLVSNEHSIFKSYKLSVSVGDKIKVLSPDIWPQGVCVEKWRNRN